MPLALGKEFASSGSGQALGDMLKRRYEDVIDRWTQEMYSTTAYQRASAGHDDVRRMSQDVLNALIQALAANDPDASDWDTVEGLLSEMSLRRARQNYTPSATASSVFAMKDSVLPILREEIASPDDLFDMSLMFNRLVDDMGLMTFEVYVKAREETITEQNTQLLELSTPVVKVWEGVLAVPLIGTLDSVRTQLVMESLLETIVETGSTVAIIDITGVPTVDTLVAQHLLKTVAAARLMGADCIISGIRPQIAQTVVHLGVEMNDIVTKASLADALNTAILRVGGANPSKTAG